MRNISITLWTSELWITCVQRVINCRYRGNDWPDICFAASLLNQRPPKQGTWNLAQYSTIQYNLIISPFQQNSCPSSLRADTHDTWILVKLSYLGWPRLFSNTRALEGSAWYSPIWITFFSAIFSSLQKKALFGKLEARQYCLTNLLGLVCLTALILDGGAESTHNLWVMWFLTAMTISVLECFGNTSQGNRLILLNTVF